MAYLMIFFPLLMAGVAALVPSNRLRPFLLPLSGMIHFLLTVWVIVKPDLLTTNSWLILDPPGKIIILLVSTLFLFCSFYTVPYLLYRKERSNRLFCSCLIMFLGAMSLVTWSQHLGLMWVAIEATTLITAPLIYFNHNQ